MAAELDHDGSPKRLAVEQWGPCLDRLGRAARSRPGWSEWVRERAGGLVMWRVHASRPDGSPVFGDPGRDRDRVAALVAAASLSADPALASVISRWFPTALPPRKRPTPPPLPALSDNDRVLAMLRPDWNADGDWLAVDHRAPGDPSRIELSADGRAWLQGSWRSEGLPDSEALPRPTAWATGPNADALEWSFRSGSLKITRTAALLRYRKVALLAQQEEGAAPMATSALRLSLADGVACVPGTDARALALTRARASARLIPLALPALPYATDRGSLAVEGGDAVLRQPSGGRRRWLPMAVAWGRPPAMWRTLTVTEKSQVCPPDVAFGARISWGVGQDGLLIYRSLGRPALRAVLGHQTRARFLIGRFTDEGDVEPLLTLD